MLKLALTAAMIFAGTVDGSGQILLEEEFKAPPQNDVNMVDINPGDYDVDVNITTNRGHGKGIAK